MTSSESAKANGGGIPPIKTTIGTRGWRARRATSRYVGQTMSSALTMSAGSTIATLLVSQLRARSPWAGLNALARLFGLGRTRARGRFESSTTLAGVAVLAGGFLALAALYQGIRRAR